MITPSSIILSEFLLQGEGASYGNPMNYSYVSHKA